METTSTLDFEMIYLEAQMPKGWTRDNSQDNILSKIKTKAIAVKPAEDNSPESESIRTIVAKGTIKYGLGIVFLLMRDESVAEGWIINPMFPEDLDKSPRQLIEELKLVRSAQISYDCFQLIDFKRAAYMAVTGAVGVR